MRQGLSASEGNHQTCISGVHTKVGKPSTPSVVELLMLLRSISSVTSEEKLSTSGGVSSANGRLEVKIPA
jgi:hypothetical protein